MINKEELQQLLSSTESYRVERTISTSNIDKFCEAICAFSNGMPDSRQNVLFGKIPKHYRKTNYQISKVRHNRQSVINSK